LDLTLNNEHHAAENVQKKINNGRINDRWVPDHDALLALQDLKPTQSLYSGDIILFEGPDESEKKEKIQINSALLIAHPTDFFMHCGQAITDQSKWVQQHWQTKRWTELSLDPQTIIIGDPSLVHVAPGARVRASTLNTEQGPIFIGPKAEVQEGSNIRGPFILNEGSIVKMGSRIYGPTVIGPHCRVGGEVSNSVFLGFSNKGHDGFLGNSVIGHWCNLGADTNTSNLKNNYSSVRLWDSASAELKATDLQFCGLIMGDHCKCAINTMFDTGTYIGSASMLTGSSFIPKHVPPFSWGGDGKWTEHRFEQFVATAKVVMERRQHLWNEDDETKWREELESSRAMRKALL
jgi:UDP-N-acetylglucosamine diphosphorylase/glucosamine-1-phosphate N-acetyltransferase